MDGECGCGIFPRPVASLLAGPSVLSWDGSENCMYSFFSVRVKDRCIVPKTNVSSALATVGFCCAASTDSQIRKIWNGFIRIRLDEPFRCPSILSPFQMESMKIICNVKDVTDKGLEHEEEL
jgi:hypothetical protein